MTEVSFVFCLFLILINKKAHFFLGVCILLGVWILKDKSEKNLGFVRPVSLNLYIAASVILYSFLSFYLKKRKIKTYIFFSSSSSIPNPYDQNAVSVLTTNNFLELRHPGVYMIFNRAKNMSYHGETQSLLQRFEKHFRALEQQVHDNEPLQEDYSSDPSSFEFLVLDWGPEWENVENRVARQNDYIDLNKERSYNIFESRPIYKRPLLINGQRFNAVREAVRVTGIPRSTLRRFLRDSSKPEYSYLEGEEFSYGKTPIFAQKAGTPSLLFDSKVEAVQAGFASNKQNVTRKLKRGETGWRYAHFDTDGKPLRISYQPKPGEITYKQWLEENSNIN